MSNLGNYSPYNKTYKFILFQNQAYHERNKRNASPCVRTNLRHSLSRHYSPPRNPERNESNITSPRHSESPENRSAWSSQLFERKKEINQIELFQDKRVIHKHQSYQKFRSKKISKDNESMVNRILGSDCQIVKKEQATKSFQNHMRYKQIRGRYHHQTGQRKDLLHLGESDLLCPTLKQFHHTGLSHKFVEKDLSMSLKPSSVQSSPRRRPLINFAVDVSELNG